MSQSDKAVLYNKLKDAGVEFDKHYRDYSEAELQVAADRLDAGRVEGPEPEEVPPSSFFGLEKSGTADVAPPPPAPAAPTERPSERLNTQAEGEVLRVDDEGRQWLQEEILKPASPRPRARRVLTYIDKGFEEKQVKVGDYIETFEVSGEGPGKTAEVKVTLPSYQVGIFRDPRFPMFKVHTYNGRQGFDLFDVQEYYNGAELVPSDVKRVYVENVLCYDIRTVVRAIESEYRQMQLTGKIKE
jgi:hypothetical protein